MLKINLEKYFDKNVSKPELIARLTFYSILFIIGSTFIIFLFFLYQRFYLTLIQAEEIVILKSQLAVDVLDNDLYQKVKSIAENRKNAPIVSWQEIHNPFPSAPVTK